MSGLTSEGLEIKRLPEILSELRSTATSLFQDKVEEGEVVNVSDNSTLGRMIGVTAPALVDIWEAIQDVYDCFNPNASYGVALDNLVALSGITRIQSYPTVANMIFQGTSGITVPVGSIIRSSTTSKTYATTTAVVMNTTNATAIGISLVTVADNTAYTISYKESNGALYNISVTSASSGATQSSIFTQIQNAITSAHPDFTSYLLDGRLFIRSVDEFRTYTFTVSSNIGVQKIIKPVIVYGQENGEIEQPANTIDTIATPILGWDSATNPYDASPGRLTETDEELRERFRLSKYQTATNVVEALYSALANVNGIVQYILYENEEDTTSAEGLPPHSFMVLARGGLATDIAQAIWNNKPLGIQAYGNTQITVLDSKGVSRVVGFSRPTAVPLYMQFTIHTDSSFPGDGVDQIKAALVSHIESLGIGEDVLYSRLFTPINSVSGFYISDIVKIGTSPSPTTFTNIALDFDEVASIVAENISITVVAS